MARKGFMMATSNVEYSEPSASGINTKHIHSYNITCNGSIKREGSNEVQRTDEERVVSSSPCELEIDISEYGDFSSMLRRSLDLLFIQDRTIKKEILSGDEGGENEMELSNNPEETHQQQCNPFLPSEKHGVSKISNLPKDSEQQNSSTSNHYYSTTEKHNHQKGPSKSSRPKRNSYRKYSCKICGQRFFDKHTLQKHAQTHIKAKDFICKFCSKGFYNKKSLNAHLTRHTERNRFPCDFCDEHFDKRLKLAWHQKNDHCGEKYTCKVCSMAFLKRRNFIAHMEAHAKKYSRNVKLPKVKDYQANNSNDEGPSNTNVSKQRANVTVSGVKSSRPKRNAYRNHPCKICGQRFFDKNALQKHVQTHIKVKDFICKFCSKGFFNKKCLNAHLTRHTGKNRFSCDFCDKRFDNRLMLAWHQKKLHRGEKYTCKVCSTVFLKRHRLMMHMVTHKKKDAKNIKLPKVKDYQVNNSNASNDKGPSNTNVSKQHANVTDSDDKSSRPKRNSYRKYPCKTCGQHFFDRIALQKHVQTHFKAKDFICKFCSKGFFSKTSLNAHLTRHTGRNRFSCDFCDERFDNRVRLAWHQKKLHRGEKYTCKICPTVFLKRHRLMIHMVTRKKKDAKNIKLPKVKDDRVNNSNANNDEGPSNTNVSKQHANVTVLDTKSSRPKRNSYRNFPCKTCGQRFFDKIALQKHVQTHFKAKDFICKFCFEGFFSKKSLNAHLTKHTGRIRFPCHFCDKRLRNRMKLAIHEKNDHPGERYTCKMCSTSFFKRSRFTLHTAAHKKQMLIGHQTTEDVPGK